VLDALSMILQIEVLERGKLFLIKDIDGKVERTKTRPLAAKEVSVSQAIKFLALQLSAGLGVLLCLNNYR
jgi:heme O synthase-like polyprenyltransferase